MKQKHALIVHKGMVLHGVMDSACGQMENALILELLQVFFFTCVDPMPRFNLTHSKYFQQVFFVSRAPKTE